MSDASPFQNRNKINDNIFQNLCMLKKVDNAFHAKSIFMLKVNKW